MHARAATAADVDAVFGMLTRFVTSYTPDRAAFDALYPRMITNERAFLRVAAQGSELVGYVMAVVFDTMFANGPVVQIEELFAEETHSGGGVGETLVYAAIDWARSLGASEVSVPTRRAGAYYERLGFVETATYYRMQL